MAGPRPTLLSGLALLSWVTGPRLSGIQLAALWLTR